MRFIRLLSLVLPRPLRRAAARSTAASRPPRHIDNENAAPAVKPADLAAAPVRRGMQVYGFGWAACLAKSFRDQLDYIARDALLFPDAPGRNVLLWTAGVEFADPEDFMNRDVDYNVRVLSEPIQVWQTRPSCRKPRSHGTTSSGRRCAWIR